MHVGLFSPVWPPGDTPNGIVTYVKIVRDELLRLGHRVTLVVAYLGGPASEHVVALKGDRRPLVLELLQRLLMPVTDGPHGIGRVIADTVVRLHQRDPLDVFEMEESFGWCEAVAARLDAPTIVKLHGPAFLSLIDGSSETPERRLRVDREGRALRAAAAVVSPSPSTLAATASRYSLPDKILSSIPNPVAEVDTGLIWRADKCDKDRILFIGRFDFRKGGDSILKAFSRVAESRPTAKLTFVGPDIGVRLSSGPIQNIKAYLESNFTPEVVSRVEYVGTKANHEIAELRLKASVTVLTTRWESFGYVVAEAMSQGCPIVGFDVDGVNELIEHGRSGLLAPLDNLDLLTQQIESVLDDEVLAAELGRQARESVMASCGAGVVVKRMLNLYERAIDARKSNLLQ